MLDLEINKHVIRILHDDKIIDYPKRVTSADAIVDKLVRFVESDFLKEIHRRCICYDVFHIACDEFDYIFKRKREDRLLLLSRKLEKWCLRPFLSHPQTRSVEKEISHDYRVMVDRFRFALLDCFPAPKKVLHTSGTQLSLF